MATVKCLDTSGRKRFVFKSFARRVDEIDIDVFRNLDAVKAAPSSGSSFLLDTIVEWRELNTTEHFISFYDEIMPEVQTLPQVILHREKIFAELLRRVNMNARLSLEPILRSIAALCRDILEEFIPYLKKLTSAFVDLLKDGGDRDPEILEQIFTSWSYILMYLQKYLVKDVVHILKITIKLRYYPKVYVQDFMAEAVSFLLRNAPNNQRARGLRKVVLEFSKNSSSRKDGSVALLWYSMRGTSRKLHSKADLFLRFLMDKSIFAFGDKLPQGSKATVELMIGLLERICSEVDPEEFSLILSCILEEITKSIADDCLEHLCRMMKLLAFVVRRIRGNKYLELESVLKSIIDKYFVTSFKIELGSSLSEVINSGFQLMLCLLDVPSGYLDLVRISNLYAPAFQLRTTSLFTFIKELARKESEIVLAFEGYILRTASNFIDCSPEDVIFILLTFHRRQMTNTTLGAKELETRTEVQRLCNFLSSKIDHWIKLLHGSAETGDCLNNQISETEAALLWGVVSCLPYFKDFQDHKLLWNLIHELAHLLDTKTDNIRGILRSTWQSLLGRALASYHEVLCCKNLKSSEMNFFISLAAKHKTSSQVLSSVADILDFLKCSLDGSLQILDAENMKDSFYTFSENLSNQNKEVRVSTLRILSHYCLINQYPSTVERPAKKLKSESEPEAEESMATNVVELLLLIETTPISISTSRTIVLLISRLQMKLSSREIHNDHIPLLLHGLLGILFNRFHDIWLPTQQCLANLVTQHKDLVWNMFVEYLATQQSKALSFVDTPAILHGETEPTHLLRCFRKYLVLEQDSTPLSTVATLLLQSLQKVPEFAQARSRQLVPLFLSFMGYDPINVQSVESYSSDKCKGKTWRMLLKEWLNLLKEMQNARSLYQNAFLKEVLLKRVLDDVDQDTQMSALECIFNWRDGFLTPFYQHFINLVNAKSLREELTIWPAFEEFESLQEGHKNFLIILIIRLLTPKVRNLKTLGSRKHAGLNHRKAILRFFSLLKVNHIELFFCLLLKPLLPRPFSVEPPGSERTAQSELTEDFVKISSSISGSDVKWKKFSGFLNVLEEVFKTFDISHIEPFLDSLLMIVVRILDSCMRKILEKNESDVNSISDDSKRNSKSALVKLVKQLKELRSLCLRIISSALNEYNSHVFPADFWDAFFAVVRPLIDNFKQEGSSSQKPSSLFSCFTVMSRNHAMAPLLSKNPNLIPAVFSILVVKSASKAVTSSVLDFVENLLRLDDDLEFQGDNPVQLILAPHIDLLVCSFHTYVQSNKDFFRKSSISTGRRELRIFKLLGKYIEDPVTAKRVVDIVLQYVRKRDIDSDDCLDGLRIIRGLTKVLGYESSAEIVKGLNPLLMTAGHEARLCICDIIDGFALHDPSLAFLVRLLRGLNAASASELDEMDYETRLQAYEEIKPDTFSELREEHVVAILSHCVYDMTSEELIFRQSASRALHSFLQFAMSVQDRKSSSTCDETAWTKDGVRRIIDTIYLENIGRVMSKNASLQQEWIALLREMVYSLQISPALCSFKALCSDDLEEDFFHNIVHLQVRARVKALSLYKEKVVAGNFSEEVMLKIFIPLFFNMLFDVRDGKEHLRNACIDTLAAVASQVKWQTYCAVLTRCFRDLNSMLEKQKTLLRLICAILDAFHFHDDDGKVMDGTSGFVSLTCSSRPVPLEKQVYLQKVFLPQVQKLLMDDPDKVNININLVTLKLLKLLPSDILESQLSTIVHRLCNFLKNRLESVRGDARTALVACLKELGVDYLLLIVKILQSILKRGYELHVLGYTLNFLLSKTLVSGRSGVLDYCLDELLCITEADILGNVAEEKEVEMIASKMKETRKSKSFETLQFIAQNVDFKKQSLTLLSHVRRHLRGHISPKMKAKVEAMLRSIALGIEGNPSAESHSLFVFAHGLIKDTVDVTSSEGSDTPQKIFLDPDECRSSSKHVITEFALQLLRNRLKRKVDKNDEDLLRMLDSFVGLLTNCLESRYQNVITAAFRCLSPLIKLPLPSVERNGDRIKQYLLTTAQKSGNTNSHLMCSCLKLLSNLLSGFKISLSQDQLAVLIRFPVFIDIQAKPSPIALSLLRSILNRKLMVPEVYDIVVKLQELMVTSQSDTIRKQCRQIVFLFLRDYSLSQKRFQQHIDFLLTNLSYEHSTGREAVIEMLRYFLEKFNVDVVDSQAKVIFLHLVLALTNERDQAISALLVGSIRALLTRVKPDNVSFFLVQSLQWYGAEKRVLWRASVQVLGLLIEVLGKRFRKHVNHVLSLAKRTLEISVVAIGDVSIEASDENSVPLWKESYFSLLMFEKLLGQFPELHHDRNSEDTWLLILKLLIHPHSRLREILSCLLASYFSSVTAAKIAHREQPFVLMHPSNLFVIVASLLKQLVIGFADDASSNLVAQNLMFSICHLHHSAKNIELSALHELWPTLSSLQQSSFLAGFELLGSMQAKDRFLLCISSKIAANDGPGKYLSMLLVSPLLTRMGNIATQMGDTQRKIVFSCFRMISRQLGSEEVGGYARSLLSPMFKVCEGFTGTVVSDEVKRMAEVARDSISKVIGLENFLQVYNDIRKRTKHRREGRKNAQKVLAVVNPMQHAKRKLRAAAKHRAHKKRKVAALRMKKWNR